MRRDPRWLSLPAAGMGGVTTEVIHVPVPREARPRAVTGVRVHRMERQPGESVSAGPPRTRPAVAIIRAIIRGVRWAASDRQAALLLVLPVQLDLLGWRLDPCAYLDQIVEAHALLTARRAALTSDLESPRRFRAVRTPNRDG